MSLDAFCFILKGESQYLTANFDYLKALYIYVLVSLPVALFTKKNIKFIQIITITSNKKLKKSCSFLQNVLQESFVKYIS